MKHVAITAIALALAGPAAAQTAAAQATATQAAGAPSAEAKLAYVIVYVSDMKKSVAFYRDQLGLKPTFASPQWSEFKTGTTVLALHPASRENAPGVAEVAFTVPDLKAFYETRRAGGVTFTGPPSAQEFGQPMTEMHDPDGGKITVGGPSKWPAPK